MKQVNGQIDMEDYISTRDVDFQVAVLVSAEAAFIGGTSDV